MREPGLYTIGEVAAMLGVSTHAIRAWERRHEVVKPLRSSAGQRRYRSEDVELLREVKRAVNLDGLSLRLAIGAVTGSHTIEAPVRTTAERSPAKLPDFENESMWRGVVDVIPELVFVVDSTGRILESNIATARLFGLTVQQVRGRLFVDFVEPFDRAKATLTYRQMSRTVEGWELNLTTPVGVPMYSFRSWALRRGAESFVVLVGSKMFTEPTSPLDIANDAARRADVMGAGTYHKWLGGLFADPRFQRPKTVRQLCDAAIDYLQRLLPTVEFAVAIAARPDEPGAWSTAYSPAARMTLQGERGASDAFGRAIRGVAATGAREEIPATLRGLAHTVKAVPFSPENRLGVLAWSRPFNDPLSEYQCRAIDAFVAWVAVATEKLLARIESAHQSSRLNEVIKAASLIRHSTEPGSMGASFLNQLARLVHADTAAIGRIVGSNFIVEAVYAPGGSITKRGDRFQLLKVFSDSLRTGQATRGTGIPTGLPERLQTAYAGIRHFLAVPVVIHGRTTHMLSLARFADRPFSETDADIVQALSATATLAIKGPTVQARRVRSRPLVARRLRPGRVARD